MDSDGPREKSDELLRRDPLIQADAIQDRGDRFRNPTFRRTDHHEHQTGDKEMSNLAVGSVTLVGMGAMKPMGQGLLPPWVTWLWLIALTAVLVLHCGHLVRMGGQHRWFHASHILMLVSMLYMYAMMEFKWTWFPKSWSVTIFSVSTAAILVWMAYRFVQRRPFSVLWVLALIMQAAMIYMWLPPKNWVPALTWALVVYYSIETVAWLARALDDSKPSMSVGPREAAGPAKPVGQAGGSQPAVAGGLLVESRTVMAASEGKHPAFVALAHNAMTDRVSMAVMAASMAYMFAAMQLMRSAM